MTKGGDVVAFLFACSSDRLLEDLQFFLKGQQGVKRWIEKRGNTGLSMIHVDDGDKTWSPLLKNMILIEKFTGYARPHPAGA